MINTTFFPYPSFPYRLEFGENKNVTVCFFKTQDHLENHLKRYKLKKKDVKITVNNKTLKNNKND